jgi:hypothetical protein
MTRKSLLASAARVPAGSKSAKTVQRIKHFTLDRGVERDGWSVGEWCATKGFSTNGFYRLPEADRPLTIRIGNKRIVTRRANDEWEAIMLERARAERRAASDSEAAA